MSKNISIIMLLTSLCSYNSKVPTKNNLIVKEWTCEIIDFYNNNFIINDSASYVKMLLKTGCGNKATSVKLNAKDFEKYTLLGLHDDAQGFCQIKYFRQVLYDDFNKHYTFTHISNGMGGCKRMGIPILQFVLIPKVNLESSIKFRYLYRGDSYGNELSKGAAKKLLNEADNKFEISLIE